MRTAARDKGIHHATLQRHIKSTKDVKDLSKMKLSPTHSTQQVLPHELDDSLAGYVLERFQLGYGLTIMEIRQFAYQLGKANNLKMPASWHQ